MTVPRYARLAGELLRDDASAEAGAQPGAQTRTQAIAALEQALARKARRRRVARISALALAAAAALALAWLGTARAPQSPAVAARGARSSARPAVVAHARGDGARIIGGEPLQSGGQALLPGARVVALPHGHALLAFATGTRVDVEQGGDVTLVQANASQVLSLQAGALRAHVAKLAAGRRFLVRTADAEVEVHGTSFRVANAAPDPGCGDGARTRVDVYEGVVTVRHAGREQYVRAGEAWPAGCTHSSAAAEQPARPQRAAAQAARQPRATGAPVPSPELVAPARAPTASELAAQNEAFAGALADKRHGRLEAAVRGFESLLARYPRGPLAESAAAQRMQLLDELDAGRAARAARDYLRLYPRGFAREQAEAIVAESR